MVEDLPGIAQKRLDELAHARAQKVGAFIYGEGETSMEASDRQLYTEKKLKRAVAESCTGGLIGHRLTNVAGSSRFLSATSSPIPTS